MFLTIKKFEITNTRTTDSTFEKKSTIFNFDAILTILTRSKQADKWNLWKILNYLTEYIQPISG